MTGNIQGLTTLEAKDRLTKFGPNVLPEKPPPSSLIIFFVVFVNSILGFIQEERAGSALSALKALVHPMAEVIRDGRKLKIDFRFVVPGDIVELEQGEKIPADGKLIKANRLFIEEAVLTGESIPVQKPHEDTPLTKQLKVFSNQLTVLVAVLIIFVFAVGLITGKELLEMFKTSVALAVSSIPEGLLIALTVVLAIGMQRILKKKGLVRNLVSAETLGGVTTICVDKTGTLTYGKLKVFEEHGDVEKVCIQHFATSDDPIMVAARGWLKENSTHFDKAQQSFNKECELIDSIPFTPQNRLNF